MDKPLHSITSSIPLTDQTNPNKFPRVEYQPYPRMHHSYQTCMWGSRIHLVNPSFSFSVAEQSQ